MLGGFLLENLRKHWPEKWNNWGWGEGKRAEAATPACDLNPLSLGGVHGVPAASALRFLSP